MIRETDDDWVHLNREYTPSEWAKALSGTLPSVMLEVSPEELARMDIYEGSVYTRVKVTLQSGTEAWVYRA